MNRVVIITGASSGIGAATALALAEHVRLVLVARRQDRLLELVQRVHALGGQAYAIAADLAGPTAPAQVVEKAVAHFGGVDALVNNAGLFETAAIGAINAEHLERLWRLNVQAPMLLAQAVLPHLRGRHGGWIVNVSSVAADAAFTGCGAYAATKAALEAWSRVLREELRGTNVRVGVVAPGATDTEIWPADSPFDRGRMCRASDVAAAIRFMLEAPASASIDRVVVAPPGGAL
jgi:NADP-dependent 3-hydroxy acid dehydrogenase YdfG